MPSSSVDDRSKGDGDYVERLGQPHTHETYIEKDEVTQLPPEHRDYLMRRHGTLDLDPVPGYGNADPYNWPVWKKVTNLILVAFHAMMTTFTAASIIPAYQVIAADLGVSLQRTTYLTSLQIAILGAAPLFWRPLANRYGRRPIFLLSLICSFAGNIGCAKSHSYAQMAACRAVVAFFISPAAAIGSAVVAESFFKKDRARYMGIWTLMITLGVPISPFIFGFVTNNVGYRWIYWILAIVRIIFLVSSVTILRLHHRSMLFSSFCTQYLDQRLDLSAKELSMKALTSSKSILTSDASTLRHCLLGNLFLHWGSVAIHVLPFLLQPTP
jgi:MFS family permease